MAEKLALVFTGGGAKGGFGVGVLAGILEAYPELRWHIVTGTSTGSLIAPLAALGASDREQVKRLEGIYRGARKAKILASNLSFWRIVWALVRWRLPRGLYRMKPLRRLVASVLPEAVLAALRDTKVATVACAVELDRGALVLCCQDSFAPTLKASYDRYVGDNVGQLPVEIVPFARYRDMLVASASIPFAVEPAEVGDARLVDGGVREFAPLRPALALGATHAIVITMSPTDPSAPASAAANLVQVGLRAVDLLEDQVLRGDLATATAAVAIRKAASKLLLDIGELMQVIGPSRSAAAAGAPPHAHHLGHALLAEYLASSLAELPVLIAPAVALGETFDFDSTVSAGWPEHPDPASPDSKQIMDARVDYGRAVAAEAIASTPALRQILERFSA
jgi:predicted acylesterase/phospholipase RssA